MLGAFSVLRAMSVQAWRRACYGAEKAVRNAGGVTLQCAGERATPAGVR
ncbi:MAG: hypothetical protein LBR08_10850 [Bacteroidales bacterium]|nr:hypothetical protein [Bacteroidales bacterium]